MNLLPLLRLVRTLPPWVAIVAAALAWGALQRHHATAAGQRAVQAEKALSQLRADAATAATQAAARAAAAHQEIAHAAEESASRARADAAGAVAALRRLQQRVAAGGGAAAPAGAASGGQAACGVAPVPPDVLGRLGEAAGQLAAIADQRGTAGSACERAYDALMR